MRAALPSGWQDDAGKGGGASLLTDEEKFKLAVETAEELRDAALKVNDGPSINAARSLLVHSLKKAMVCFASLRF